MNPKKFGRYEIVAELGRGSMGVVYKAFDPVLKRHLAIKSMGAAARADKEFVQRFFREAQATAGLNHPNIVALYDIGEADSQPYIAIEFLDGDDLESILDKGVFIPFERKLDIMIQLCEGLAHAHSRDVVHRDIKPSNVQLTPRGDVKIVDFGIAKLLSSSVTTTGQLMGTPSYMAPEQVSGAQVDHRSDIFGAGVMLYQLVTGQKPFAGDDFRTVMFSIASQPHQPVNQLLPACPPDLVSILDQALAKDPTERFQSARELQDALRGFRHDLPRLGDELKAEVTRLQADLEARRSDFKGKPEAMILAEDLLSVLPVADPDQTVFGIDVDKDQDYGGLLLRQAQLAGNLERLGQLAGRLEELQALGEQSRELLEREDWQGCLLAVEQILELIPESQAACERRRLCLERLEPIAPSPETTPPVEDDPGPWGAEPAARELHEVSSVGPLPALDGESPSGEAGVSPPAGSRHKLWRWGIPLAVLLIAIPGISAWLFWSQESRPVSIYQVQAGDTLDGLAARFDVDAGILAGNNQLQDSAPLIPGQVLELGSRPRDAGTLVLDFAPWAQIESIVRSSDGTEVLRAPALTPLTLRLAAGSYVVKAGNPELGSNLEFTVDITAGALEREERPMPGFDLGSELDSLFGQGGD